MALGGYYAWSFVVPRADRGALLPGPTSSGHHAIESKCDACHTPFRGVTNDACNRCHGAPLAAAEDTHPEGKFTDPRNADRVSGLDARACVTCHREHVPDRTRADGVTLPSDFCGQCHEDIGRERPSHRGFSFHACASTGCHRFHDNRSLYEGFLVKHLHEPDGLLKRVLPRRQALPTGATALTLFDQDGPTDVVTETVVREWSASAHARAEVNCTACHAVPDAATGTGQWTDHPGHGPCATCHPGEEAGFLGGKHGMRLAAGLGPMKVSLARLPMKADVVDRALGCGSCHGVHAVDTRRGAVEACLSCHDDKHSRAYPASRHYQLWLREGRGETPAGTGVSCAVCHLPRETHRVHGTAVTQVQHNQNANLRPRDKMLRSVCLTCHGLGFSVDALADADLVNRNFNGRPSVHVPSLELAELRVITRQAAKGKTR